MRKDANTDGILVKVDNEEDEKKYLLECDKWCKRTMYDLEHDYYTKVIQKDVNNYIIVEEDGSYKSKGAYVKKLSKIDYDLPIVNEALINFFTKDIPVEETILNCNDLIKFQKVVKLTGKYRTAIHNDKILNERVFRVFASNAETDGTIFKIKGEDKYEKIANTPLKCFICNENVIDILVDERLDKTYYVELANDRIYKFLNNKFVYKPKSEIKGVSYKAFEECSKTIDANDTFYGYIKNKNNSTIKDITNLIKAGYLKKYGSVGKLLKLLELHTLLGKKTYKIDTLSDELKMYLMQGENVELEEVTENVVKEDITDDMYIVKENKKTCKVTYMKANITYDYCTEKNGKLIDLDKDGLFAYIDKNVEYEEISVIDDLANQLELLGYANDIPKNISLAKVEMTSTKNKSCNLKSYRNNTTRWFKIEKGLTLPSQGDVIVIQQMYSKKGWKGRIDWYVKKYKKIA